MPDFCLKGGKVLRSIEIPYGRGRQIFVNENALQAERFIDKWLDIAKKNPPQPRGDSAFQMWWKNKNAELGKDRRIAW